MKGKTLFKTIIVVFLVAWACLALWPTYKLHHLTAEHRLQLENEGKLVPLLNKAIRLGLDLQGGMYLTYEIDLPELVSQMAENKDPIYEDLMTQVREDMNVRSIGFFELMMEKFTAQNIPLHRYWGDRRDSDEKIIKYLQEQANDAMDRAMQKLRNRIDQFGVAEPNIQKVGARRILIELPGVTNETRAKELIGKTALLEWSLLKDLWKPLKKSTMRWEESVKGNP